MHNVVAHACSEVSFLIGLRKCTGRAITANLTRATWTKWKNKTIGD